MARSHAHQYLYVGDRLTFKTVATRLAIAPNQSSYISDRFVWGLVGALCDRASHPTIGAIAIQKIVLVCWQHNLEGIN
ncbi:hypothetical protein PQG02_35115 (plasmid) [Nostoc sp. UHCC 0926]|uniref:hypothetical protein n=1 Tax=Nostoc sp. UHCC 0926 TaxID=3025190 RepID=UPI002363049F|nr:hypothetical protein [Nostoc sp. UHCC 0926]WDD37040.1 hypothetical protein PQG02_35115 [Nostoc sp. UHCC 0926]